MATSVTRAEVRGGLRGLDIEAGDGLAVHSSLSSLGWVEGGTDSVVDALFDAVGEDGTLLMPTFTGYDDVFDPDQTPSETGAVTEAFRQRDGVVRSDHPTKSVAVAGPDAGRLVADHRPLASLGVDSPFHRFLESGGDVLLVGVGHTRNSSLHVAEKVAGVPYRDQVAETRRVTADGTERVRVNRVHCSEGFGVAGPLLRAAGLERRGQIGDATVRLLDGEALLDLIADTLRHHPGFLLCAAPDCERCAYARRQVADAGADANAAAEANVETNAGANANSDAAEGDTGSETEADEGGGAND
jgi:aminoglycoside 3-N-acetyltransferase